MILTIVVNVIPVVLRSTNTQPIRDSYVDLGYLETYKSTSTFCKCQNA